MTETQQAAINAARRKVKELEKAIQRDSMVLLARDTEMPGDESAELPPPVPSMPMKSADKTGGRVPTHMAGAERLDFSTAKPLAPNARNASGTFSHAKSCEPESANRPKKAGNER